jgi:DNA adenine methylase
MKVHVPPIKSQGIKTKLVPWIREIVPAEFNGRWIEPFLGTGVVAFNLAPNKALLCDTNPHIIRFYDAISTGEITSNSVRQYLGREGQLLYSKGEDHYYFIRDRFNEMHQPLDFLFVSRAGFNGMMRFNKKGKFNIPFCRKPNRFAQSYITKIANQVEWVFNLIRSRSFEFRCQDFNTTIQDASPGDIVYCDPPYIGRHVEYFNGWGAEQERMLFENISTSSVKFIVSTWHHTKYRSNDFIPELWSRYRVLTREHFYHVGAKEKNRGSVTEALITNIEAFSNEQNILERLSI